VDGLSIGFRTVKATRDGRTGHRKLWEIDLWEISIVTFPMMDLARIAPGKPPANARLERSLQAAMSAFKH
jgi:HK97 family phage prohead protease